MKRLAFLAALFGGGRLVAQQRTPPPNNQCPVCGTMADPLKPYKTGLMSNCKGVPGQPYVVSCEDQWAVPDPRLVRCKGCNAAFWQDCEKAVK